jgi:hypothetical protein
MVAKLRYFATNAAHVEKCTCPSQLWILASTVLHAVQELWLAMHATGEAATVHGSACQHTGYCSCRRCYQSLKTRVHAERMTRQTSFHAPGTQLGLLSTTMETSGPVFLPAEVCVLLQHKYQHVPALRSLTVPPCLVLKTTCAVRSKVTSTPWSPCIVAGPAAILANVAGLLFSWGLDANYRLGRTGGDLTSPGVTLAQLEVCTVIHRTTGC